MLKAKRITLRKFFQLGGQGSGNFGHEGRPGEVGGSSKGKGREESVSTIQPLRNKSKYYYHRSTTRDTDTILSSGYIKGSDDNFAPEIYQGMNAEIGEEPVVFFGVDKNKLHNFYTTFTTQVASNITNTPLEKVLVYDPSDGEYYDVTDLYRKGIRTESELVSSYLSEQ